MPMIPRVRSIWTCALRLAVGGAAIGEDAARAERPRRGVKLRGRRGFFPGTGITAPICFVAAVRKSPSVQDRPELARFVERRRVTGGEANRPGVERGSAWSAGTVPRSPKLGPASGDASLGGDSSWPVAAAGDVGLWRIQRGWSSSGADPIINSGPLWLHGGMLLAGVGGRGGWVEGRAPVSSDRSAEDSKTPLVADTCKAPLCPDRRASLAGAGGPGGWESGTSLVESSVAEEGGPGGWESGTSLAEATGNRSLRGLWLGEPEPDSTKAAPRTTGGAVWEGSGVFSANGAPSAHALGRATDPSGPATGPSGKSGLRVFPAFPFLAR
ncbi:uncharacterized PE-PGRS family protein PE_PGRS36 [Triticum aestivum]|uniref:uncharacterized PE-PGRS family protein PE_PGRS36 n=1 Tax=Triticum aestivum TaxID=4565 RepID=UPI001D023030|nr:uncharacterized PE-PGRS family protein PE_PGRS36-like [Triticum aestivum]